MNNDYEYDVVGFGELLIDFTPLEQNVYKANPGGGPPNMLAALAKLGHKSAFMGKVGSDQFGIMLKKELDKIGIDTGGVLFTDHAFTTLAFVHLDESGDRSFSFSRKPGADTLYSVKDINYSILDNSNIFHFSSLSMTSDISGQATMEMLEYCRKNNKTISFDPNLRESLWDDLDRAKKSMLSALEYATIVKLSEVEVEFLFDTTDYKKAAEKIMDYGVEIVFITLGSEGAHYAHNGFFGHVGAFPAKVIDTTGAGDAFTGGAISRLLGTDYKKGDKLSQQELGEISRFASGVGSLSTTKLGGISSMPTQMEVYELLEANKDII